MPGNGLQAVVMRNNRRSRGSAGTALQVISRNHSLHDHDHYLAHLISITALEGAYDKTVALTNWLQWEIKRNKTSNANETMDTKTTDV